MWCGQGGRGRKEKYNAACVGLFVCLLLSFQYPLGALIWRHKILVSKLELHIYLRRTRSLGSSLGLLNYATILPPHPPKTAKHLFLTDWFFNVTKQNEIYCHVDSSLEQIERANLSLILVHNDLAEYIGSSNWKKFVSRLIMF